MKEKTKTMLALAVGIIALALLFCGGIISEFTANSIQEKDWARVAIILGWPLIALAEYYRPMTQKRDKENAGCTCFMILSGLLLISLYNVFKIEHFTTPIIVILVITAILTIPACLLSYRKWRRVKKELEEEVDEKN